jgi:hypothetical protein
MSRFLAFTAVLVAGWVAVAGVAQADVVGFYEPYSTGAATKAQQIVVAQGHTFATIPDLSAGSLAGLDVLWILNGSTVDHPSQLTTNAAAVATFVAGGGILLYHDRCVTDVQAVLPGGGGVAFTRQVAANIDVLDPAVLVTDGPGGVVTNTTLDGGNFSDHGYADDTTLPYCAVAILSTEDPTHVVDFVYPYGDGAVYYSSVPLDYYLAGAGVEPARTNFREIYGPNVVAFALSNLFPPPDVSCTVARGLLYPARGALLAVGLTHSGVGEEGSEPMFVGLEVWSDEPDGPAPFSPDAGYDEVDLLLRADRSSTADGRVYLVAVFYSDECGIEGHGCCTVVVPKLATVASLTSVQGQAAAAEAACAAGAPPGGYVQLLEVEFGGT